jgi:hypothetical protein
MTELETLLAIEAVKQLKARYCYALDTKDAAGYAAVFGEDGVFDIRRSDVNGVEAGRAEPGPALHGGAQIAAAVLGALEGVQSSHRAFLPIVEITSPTTAKATWTMEDWLRPPGGALAFAGFGYYHDDYVKRGGDWFIARSELVRWT